LSVYVASKNQTHHAKSSITFRQSLTRRVFAVREHERGAAGLELAPTLASGNGELWGGVCRGLELERGRLEPPSQQARGRQSRIRVICPLGRVVSLCPSRSLCCHCLSSLLSLSCSLDPPRALRARASYLPPTREVTFPSPVRTPYQQCLLMKCGTRLRRGAEWRSG